VKITTGLDGGTVTAAIHMAPNPDFDNERTPRIVINADFDDYHEPEPGESGFGFWLDPSQAVALAHLLIVLTEQVAASLETQTLALGKTRTT
jgi:hypothetical protein